jgi:CTP synthase
MHEQPEQNGSELLKSVAKTSDQHEFYTPVPDGYEVGRTKYVFVFGTVLSGLGKGIFASSLAKILQDKGLKVYPIKLEGYINIDSGTLNPYRHGEVFVLDDGMECDMDLGTYERMLNLNLTKDNFSTTGQIFTKVLEKERAGKYLGRDVQIIPHVTAEVKMKLRNLAVKEGADAVFVEVGGTVGDFENMHYIEAIREMIYEEGRENTCAVALTYILEPQILGEQKSKAAQLGIKKLMEMGIQPDIIACRCASEVKEKIMEKISIYTNVPVERVFSMHDMKSIYLIPGLMREKKLDLEVIKKLKLENKVSPRIDKENLERWQDYIGKLNSVDKEITIGVTGKYTSIRDSYASIIKALEHAGTHHMAKINIKWIDTTAITKDNVHEFLRDIQGIIVPGGFGARGTEGKIECIRHARENKIPYLGICYGFQMAVIEFARNVCKLKDANSAEINVACENKVIDILPEQKKIEGLGGNMRLGGRDIEIMPGTKVAALYGGKMVIRERFRHRYEVDPKYIETFEKNGLIFSGKAPNVLIMQFLELKDHPFFVGTQAHPCFTSRPLSPSPLFMGLVKAALSVSVKG